MIVQAACRVKDKVYVGKRHCFIINRQYPELKELPYGYFKGCEQGFVDENGNFLDREQAAKHALEDGQVETGKAKGKHVFDGHTLYSEDLY